MASPVGGLYLEVKLDTRNAVQALENLQKVGKRVVASLRTPDLGLAKQAQQEADAARRAYESVAKAREQAAKPVRVPTATGGAGGGGARGQLGASSLYGSRDEYALAKARVIDYQNAVQRAWAKINATTAKGAGQTAKNVSKVGSGFTAVQKSLYGSRADFEKWAKGATDAATKVAKVTKTSTASFGQSFLQLGSRLGGLVGALKTGNIGFAINNLFSGAAQSMSTLAAAGPAVAAGLIAAVGAATALAAAIGTVVVSLKKIGTIGVTEGAKLQSTFITFGAILGDAAKAEKDFLLSRAEGSVFDFGGLANVDRTLLAYNVLDKEIRQGAIDSLITLGTVGGKSVEEVRSGAIALGQAFQSGSLRGTEVLQLVNSVGVGIEVFKELPQYAEKSVAELRKMQEEGLLPATDLFKALEIRAQSYGDVVEEMTNTVQGQMNKLRQDLPAQIGEAFRASGAIDSLTPIIRNIYEFLSSIDWSRIGAGFKNVFDTIGQIVERFLNSGAGKAIRFFFEGILPYILEQFSQGLSAAAGVFSVVFSPVIETIKSVIDTLPFLQIGLSGTGEEAFGVADIIGFMGEMFVTGIGTLRIFISAVTETVQNLIELGKMVYRVGDLLSKALNPTNWLNGSVQQAWNNFTGTFRKIGKNIQEFQDNWDEVTESVVRYRVEIQKAVKEAKQSTRNDFGFETPFPGAGEPGRTGETPGPISSDKDEKALEDFLRNLDKLQQHINDLKTKLYDMTKQWFGMRSELERGLLGEEGFTASKSSIANTSKQIMELLMGLGDFRGAYAVQENTKMLLRLADARDEIAEKLRDAETKLKEAIRQRDDFASEIRQQSIDFVNALKLEEEEVESIQRIDGEGVSGYLVTKTKETESFLEAQRKRLDDLREFQNRINSLAAKGLDKGLLEQLVKAGPDQALVVLRQLDEGGAAVIAEVNAIQKEVGRIATEVGNENATRFYQAGVDAATSQAEGLLRAAAFVNLAAANVVKGIYAQTLPLAQNMRNVGTSAGAALASGISSGAQIGVNAAKKASDASKLYALSAVYFMRDLQALVATHQATANVIGRFNPQGAAEYRQRAFQSIGNWAIGQIQQNPQISVYIGNEEIKSTIRSVIDGNVRYGNVNGQYYGAY